MLTGRSLPFTKCIFMTSQLMILEGLKCFFAICIVSLISVALWQDCEIPGKHFRYQIFSKTKQGGYNKCFQAKNFTDICYNFMLLCKAEMAFLSFYKRSINSFLSQVQYFEPVTLKKWIEKNFKHNCLKFWESPYFKCANKVWVFSSTIQRTPG